MFARPWSFAGEALTTLTVGACIEPDPDAVSVLGGGLAGRLLEGGTEALYGISRPISGLLRCC
jgi:hypothetical protein